MRTLWALLLVAPFAVGCGVIQRKYVANITGWARICVDGVSYLQFPSGVAVEVDAQGKPRTCAK